MVGMMGEVVLFDPVRSRVDPCDSTAQSAEKPSIIFSTPDAGNTRRRVKANAPCESNTPAAAAVLDTNVVLDWLLFRDPCAAALGAALQNGQLCWVTCARMREEFARTLGRTSLARWQPERTWLLARFDLHALVLPEPPPTPLRLRCDDPDDQIFVDLALACGARWLLTHDKALLRLRRRMPPDGPCIAKPTGWPGP